MVSLASPFISRSKCDGRLLPSYSSLNNFFRRNCSDSENCFSNRVQRVEQKWLLRGSRIMSVSLTCCKILLSTTVESCIWQYSELSCSLQIAFRSGRTTTTGFAFQNGAGFRCTVDTSAGEISIYSPSAVKPNKIMILKILFLRNSILPTSLFGIGQCT